MNIFINYDDQTVVNNINDGLLYLKNISMSMPSDFRYKSALTAKMNELIKIKNDLTNLVSWYKESQKEYEKLLIEINDSLNNIPKIAIKKANSIVK